MNKAFTMIELVFVIVILGVLAAVAIPRLATTRDDAQISAYVHSIRSSINDISSYYTASGDFSSLNKMTTVSSYDDLELDLSNGGIVYFTTSSFGNARQRCVKFDFSSDGNLSLSSVSNVQSGICSLLQKDSAYKTLVKTYKLGGKGIVYN